MKLIRRNYRSFRVKNDERTQSIRMMAGVGATPVRRLKCLSRSYEWRYSETNTFILILVSTAINYFIYIAIYLLSLSR